MTHPITIPVMAPGFLLNDSYQLANIAMMKEELKFREKDFEEEEFYDFRYDLDKTKATKENWENYRDRNKEKVTENYNEQGNIQQQGIISESHKNADSNDHKKDDSSNIHHITNYYYYITDKNLFQPYECTARYDYKIEGKEVYQKLHTLIYVIDNKDVKYIEDGVNSVTKQARLFKDHNYEDWVNYVSPKLGWKKLEDTLIIKKLKDYSQK